MPAPTLACARARHRRLPVNGLALHALDRTEGAVNQRAGVRRERAAIAASAQSPTAPAIRRATLTLHRSEMRPRPDLGDEAPEVPAAEIAVIPRATGPGKSQATG